MITRLTEINYSGLFMRCCVLLIWTVGVIAVWCSVPDTALSLTLESRYAVITYDNAKDLKDFNDELYMGRLKSQVRRSDTVEEEVVAKIDFIVEKVMLVLDMFPRQLEFKIRVHAGVKGVQQSFRELYKMNVYYIAFYSPSQNTVFYSADDATLRVVAHEIGHVVAENYFTISPPQRIHEVMAQFAEQHITD
jgi:hypothetical protein